MTSSPRLCLNMIVKNEMANLPRCLGALAAHIDGWVIGDTGSTDGTQHFIRTFFAERGIPGELHSFPFINFEQARNAALDRAYASALAYDYLLFCDADMELVVDEPDFRARLTAPGYDLLQRSGVSYWNSRIVRRDAGARYHGVTHEYLEVPGGTERFHGVWYKDHASGANRVDKFERDIRLLLEALEQEPENRRYWFYLAQSYKDAGRLEEAARTYARRADMGGWDEEAWYARLQEARCLRGLGDEGGFLRRMLAAYNQRPSRAEPLYELAKYYRERGMNDASLLFSEPALTIPLPAQDVLFVEDYIYTAGLQEEYAIAANYSRDPARKDRGFAACNRLALDRAVPARTRDLARWNLKFYVRPAREMMPSFAPHPVGFTPPEGFHAMNPSVARQDGELVLVQRCVNYTINGKWYVTPGGGPFQTRNYLLRLTNDFATRSAVEILPPADTSAPALQRFLGFEDARLFFWRGALWQSVCVRQMNDEWLEQLLARIAEGADGTCRLTDWRLLQPDGPRQHQKNWMPRIDGDMLEFIQLCDPTRLVDDQGKTVKETVPPIAADEFRGGSQAIPFDNGRLCLVHERLFPAEQLRYHHRFVWFDEAGRLCGVSRPFYFEHAGIEFAAGLAWHPDGRRLVISYGVKDHESRIATVEAEEVRRLLDDAANLPSAAPGTECRAPLPSPGNGKL